MARAKKRKKVSKKTKEENKQALTNRVLLIIFLVLCVVVFALAIVMINKNSEYQKEKYDIKVPLTSEDLQKGVDMEISMDGIGKNKSKEYRIQVTNYVNDNINSKAEKYKIEVSLPKKSSDIDVELYSSEENYELLNGKKTVTDLRLTKEKKQTVTYTLKLTQRNEEKEDEFVRVVFSKDE